MRLLNKAKVWRAQLSGISSNWQRETLEWSDSQWEGPKGSSFFIHKHSYFAFMQHQLLPFAFVLSASMPFFPIPFLLISYPQFVLIDKQ